MKSFANVQKQPRQKGNESPNQKQSQIFTLRPGEEPYFNTVRAQVSAPVKPQTKMTINEPGDIFEREADRIADNVMRMPEPEHNCNCGGTCDECKKKAAGSKQLQTKSINQYNNKNATAPYIVNDVISSPGQPLDKATKSFFEPRFGRNFSKVRVHTDDLAAESAGAVQARAYTVGNHDAENEYEACFDHIFKSYTSNISIPSSYSNR